MEFACSWIVRSDGVRSSRARSFSTNVVKAGHCHHIARRQSSLTVLVAASSRQAQEGRVSARSDCSSVPAMIRRPFRQVFWSSARGSPSKTRRWSPAHSGVPERTSGRAGIPSPPTSAIVVAPLVHVALTARTVRRVHDGPACAEVHGSPKRAETLWMSDTHTPSTTATHF